MKLRSLFFIYAMFCFALMISTASAADINCAQCGMTVDLDSKFTSRIVVKDTTLYFCDIGDFFTYLNRKKPAAVKTEVRDYPSGEWIDAKAASYVHSEKKFKTPMGWGIAAFREKSRAAEFGDVMAFDAAAKKVH